MSFCPPALWADEFGDEPMPEGTTYWDFALKREKKWAGDDIQGQAEFIKSLESIGNPILDDYIEEQKARLAGLYAEKIKLEREGLDV